MAINKKLIHFKNKLKFNEELAKGNILETSIVFILDTTEIYTHGLFYDGSTFDSSDIEASIQNIINNKQNTLVSGTNIKTINGESILGEGDLTVTTEANIQAVDTGDIVDDVNVEYTTKAYVDGLVGDINSVLESIING